MVDLRERSLTCGGILFAALVITGCQSTSTPVATPSPTMTAPNAGTMAKLVNRHVDELTPFTSPSGNVGCLVDATMARCDIAERSWAPPLRPADCEFGYGQGITLSPGRPAEFVCAGDTTLASGDKLAYGDSITAGRLRCESADAEISCRDTVTGHGFAISRDAYHLF